MIRKAKRIMELAIEITHSTEADVFVEYAAHVNWIGIHYYPKGFDNKETHNRVELGEIILEESDVTVQKLQDVIDKLEDLKDEA